MKAVGGGTKADCLLSLYCLDFDVTKYFPIFTF
jgi:hypothetical protein